MIDDCTCQEIQREAQAFWDKEVRKDYFIQTAQGSEIGHSIADLVGDKTTAWLALNYTTCYQYGRRGNKLSRSMGDIWLEHNGIYHPINVKTGVSLTNGRPNMVSLKRLLGALLLRQIDSYYLLIVKVELQKPIECAVHFVDMLDYLDYVAFDSGPGQIMLKARVFFSALASEVAPPECTIKQKVEKLLDLLEGGERRLAKNRKTGLEDYRKRVQAYSSFAEHVVTPGSQETLNLR